MDYTHSNDPGYPGYNKLTEDVPNNGRLLRNLAMASNYLMSHILHFYHLVALDYVDVNGTGLIPKGFLCPNYDSNYYARGIDPVLQTGGLAQPAYTVNAIGPAAGSIPAALLGDLTPYFAAQYVRALKVRRMAHQLGAIFAGKMPHASAFTPGCMTTKSYNTDPAGEDAAVVQKVHELLYGGPGFNTATYVNPDGTTKGSSPWSMSAPNPESLMGFIGKPADFWAWAGDTTGSLGAIGFSPEFLPPWAQLGVTAANPLTTGNWKHGGTFCFDTVAAAHCFPEYFWIGSGWGRYLAWGIFEGAPSALGSPDNRLLTRGRVHIPRALNPNIYPGATYNYDYEHYAADHLQAKEFTTNSWYDDSYLNKGRHMWAGKTTANAGKAGAYTFAKTPRYFNNESTHAWAGNYNNEAYFHPNHSYLPYEVGPLARMISNASLLGIPGGPASPGEVTAVESGVFGCYYPGILSDVDRTVGPLAPVTPVTPTGVGIGVFPTRGTNMAAHIGFLAGAGVFYLPPNAFSPLVLADGFYMDYMGGATLDRIAARTLETYYVGAQMLSWFNQLDYTQPSNKTLYFSWKGEDDRTAPRCNRKGAGLTEAPRGALGHWIKIGKGKTHPKEKGFRGKVSNYQIITPTAWNISPKDALDVVEMTTGAMGPIERCIWGTPLVADAEPIEILRVIHSFDPCCACTVHLANPKKEKVFEATLEALI